MAVLPNMTAHEQIFDKLSKNLRESMWTKVGGPHCMPKNLAEFNTALPAHAGRLHRHTRDGLHGGHEGAEVQHHRKAIARHGNSTTCHSGNEGAHRRRSSWRA